MSPLISSIDHVVILTNDGGAAANSYATLLGRAADETRVEDGVAITRIATGNVAVELMSATGAGARAERVRTALHDGEGLKSIVFRTPDIEGFHRRADRIGMRAGEISTTGAGDRSVRLSDESVGGVRLFAIERKRDAAAAQPTEGGVLGLDHVVVRTGNADRAAAIYGARLGLDMRLDREVRARRLMFFRCGDAIVEIAVEPGLDRDQLWGLSWRVANADDARARMARDGFSVSEVRTGAKPGTRVFTVRDGTAGVPTLMIQPAPQRD